jgi:anthrone oxygenase-like protein
MDLITALVATMAAGVFTGAAVYITSVEHPARVSCGSVLAVTEFGPSYKRAAVMQASLAIIGASAGIARWATGAGIGWVVGGVALGAVVPFTLVVILPTNHRLLDPSLDKGVAGGRGAARSVGPPPRRSERPEPRGIRIVPRPAGEGLKSTVSRLLDLT